MVSLIVVDYNSIDETVKYIKRVHDNIINADSLNTIIIDNYKNEDALKHLDLIYKYLRIEIVLDNMVYLYSSDFGIVAYCNSGENLGYAKGNNLGSTISDILFNDKYYIISNNDLLFQTKLDWKIIESIYASDVHICVIGPKIIDTRGGYQSPNKRLNAYNVLVYQYLINLKPFKWKGDLDYTFESKLCYRVSGCFMIIKSDIFRNAGRFDENTFLFSEEMILSERLSKIKARVYFYNDATLLHNHSVTVKANSSTIQAEQWCYDSYVYYFLTYRNTSNTLLLLSKYIFKLYLFRKKIRILIKKVILYERNQI